MGKRRSKTQKLKRKQRRAQHPETMTLAEFWRREAAQPRPAPMPYFPIAPMREIIVPIRTVTASMNVSPEFARSLADINEQNQRTMRDLAMARYRFEQDQIMSSLREEGMADLAPAVQGIGRDLDLVETSFVATPPPNPAPTGAGGGYLVPESWSQNFLRLLNSELGSGDALGVDKRNRLEQLILEARTLLARPEPIIVDSSQEVINQKIDSLIAADPYIVEVEEVAGSGVRAGIHDIELGD